MIMKPTLNEESTLTKTKDETQTPQSDTNDDLHFSFFSTDESEINAGIGVSIDPSHNFDQSKSDTKPLDDDADLAELVEQVAKVDDTIPTLECDIPEHQTDEPDTPAAEPEKEHSSELIIHSDESINSESKQSEPESILEKSAKLFDETRKAMGNVDIRLRCDPVLYVRESVPIAQGSLYIEADVEAEPFTDDLGKLEDEYNDKITSVREKIIEVEKPVEIYKKTVADRIGISVHWMTDTFVVSPVRGIFRAMHNGVTHIVGYIGSVLKFLLISVVATIGFYIVLAHYSDSGLSAYEMASQHYEVVKNFLVTLYKDISSGIRGIEEQ